MKGKFFINLASVLSFFAISGELTAQVVKHERLLSFEEAVPQELSGAGSTLSLSDEHYKDGSRSLRWTYKPGAVLSLKKDLKLSLIHISEPTRRDGASRMPSSA